MYYLCYIRKTNFASVIQVILFYMAKDNNIITFRASQEALSIIEKLKAEKKVTNVSEFINERICSYREHAAYEQPVTRFIPAEGIDNYMESHLGLDEAVRQYSQPFSRLSISKHAEIKSIIEENGLGYYYFKVDEDCSLSIIAANKEEASMQFAEYFTYSKTDKRYVRTMKPLPQYRYDVKTKTIIIIEY